MPDKIFTDPRLAAVYDLFNDFGADAPFYVELAGAAPKRVLEVGCGTGRLACALAARGHKVTGVDPAAAMLDEARRKPEAGKIAWVEGFADTLDLAARFDLIVMTGHVFQVFLEDAEILAVLVNLKRHLAEGGTLAFETRNPAAREWEAWTEDDSETVEHPELGPVEARWVLTSAEDRFVTFETRTRFADGTELTAPSTLRFVTQSELAALLERAGFTEVAWYGDWDKSPLGEDKPEIIVLAR
ncbi:MAG: methyltransferase domain-containing protein [Rhodovibrionaceae bacterium]